MTFKCKPLKAFTCTLVKHLAHRRCSTDIDSLPLPISFPNEFRPISAALPHWFLFPTVTDKSLSYPLFTGFPYEYKSAGSIELEKKRGWRGGAWPIIELEDLFYNSGRFYFPSCTLLETKANQRISLLLKWDLEVQDTRLSRQLLQTHEPTGSPEPPRTPPLPPWLLLSRQGNAMIN